jgi:hypothetical protein
MSAKKIIENYYNNKNQFSTLYIKSSARYSDNKQTQNVTAEMGLRRRTNFGKHSISKSRWQKH